MLCCFCKLYYVYGSKYIKNQKSNPSEFKPAAWSVGKTYHNLVQAKVGSGIEQRLEFEQLHRSSPHAAEMIAAEREHRAALMKGPRKGDKQEDRSRQEDRSKDRRPCPTWNDYEVEGKCKWDAENPTQKCNRVHSCSYCSKKGNGRTQHQARFCKRKLEDDR